MLKSLVNLVLPHRCLKCEEILESGTGLCPGCWSKIHFITDPFCQQCGIPLEYDLGDQAICGMCSKGGQSLTHVRSLFVYDDTSRDLILKFKHGDALHSTPFWGQQLSIVGRTLLENADVLTPIPLHWTRLVKRTYNQAHVLGRELSRLHPQVNYQPNLLKRIKATKSQGHLTQNQRLINIQGSIRVTPKYQESIQGKTIVLIDDVITSGATLNTCAKVLLKAGASQVDALTLGRVTRQ